MVRTTRYAAVLCSVALSLVALGLAALLLAASPNVARAYEYLRTDTGTVYNRCYVDAWNDESGYLALTGADPHGPRLWMPSFEVPAGWHGFVRSFRFELEGQNGVRDSLFAENGTWEIAGARFGHGVVDLSNESANGTGFGCLATYGYHWEGSGEIARLGGYDAHITARTYIDDSQFGNNLYAEVDFWPRVKVRYDAMGGLGAPPDQWKYMGSVMAIADKSPSRVGYTFEGWALEPGGQVRIAPGQRVGYEDWNLTQLVRAAHDWQNGPTAFFGDEAGGTVSPTGSNVITLYAVWRPVSYEVEYRGNGATAGSMANDRLTYDEPRRLTVNAYRRTYELSCDARGGSAGMQVVACRWPFSFWNTDPAGIGLSYPDGALVQNLRSAPGTYRLFAQWSPSVVVLPSPGERGLSEFLGWYTEAAGGVRLGGAGETVPLAANATCYAQWRDLSKVEYLVDGESTPLTTDAAVAGEPYYVNDEATRTAEKPNCAGVDGWYVDAACTMPYVDGTPAPAGTMRLYAKNRVELRYALADASKRLLETRTCWMDEERRIPAHENLMLPSSRIYYWGDRVTFELGHALWFEDRATLRVCACKPGVFSSAEAVGASQKTARLTQNTVGYLLWGVPQYEGIELS